MPDLELKANEMTARRVQSVMDYMTKLDSKFIKDITSNGIKSADSLSDLKKALKHAEADCENDTTDGDKYGASLTYHEAHFKKCLGNEKFVSIFKQLPIEEQIAWTTELFKHICKDLPNTLTELLPGGIYPGDLRTSTTERPDWLDMEKFQKGQQFAKDNYGMMWLASLYGITLLYNFEDGLRPVIMNQKTHTPYAAFKRYLSTLKRMDEILFGDPWTEGTPAYKEVQNIRRQHYSVRQKLCKYDNKTLYNASTLKDPYAPSYDAIQKDLQTSCPIPAQGQCPFNFWSNSALDRPKSLSQTAMSLTQFGFIGFIISKPEVVGICNATDENLEAFCHLWRGIGYLLGVKDEFNFCRGSLEEIKQRAKDFIEYWVKPALRDYNKDTEHITRALYDGINHFFPLLNYETMTLQVLELLDLQSPNLYASLSYPTWLFYHAMNFMGHYLVYIPFVRKGMNMLLLHAKNRALTFDAKKLAEIKEKCLKSALNNSSIYQPLLTAE